MIKIATPWGSGGNYSAGADRWSGTATEVAPAGGYFTPKVAAPAQYVNYLFRQDELAINAIVDFVNPIPALNWTSVTNPATSNTFYTLLWLPTRNSWVITFLNSTIFLTESFDGGKTWSTPADSTFAGSGGNGFYSTKYSGPNLAGWCFHETEIHVYDFATAVWSTVSFTATTPTEGNFHYSTQLGRLVLGLQDGTTSRLVSFNQLCTTEHDDSTQAVTNTGSGLVLIAEGGGVLLAVFPGRDGSGNKWCATSTSGTGLPTWTWAVNSFGITPATTTTPVFLHYSTELGVFVLGCLSVDSATLCISTSANGTVWTLISTTNFNGASWITTDGGSGVASLLPNYAAGHTPPVVMLGNDLIATVQHQTGPYKDYTVFSNDLGATWSMVELTTVSAAKTSSSVYSTMLATNGNKAIIMEGVVSGKLWLSVAGNLKPRRFNGSY